MTLLMYFNSFGIVLVLFASTIAIFGWTVKNFVRIVRQLFQQSPDAAHRKQGRRWNAQEANQLKRAGQF